MVFDEKESHPSYGMISIHRQTGSFENMFGSSIKRHNTSICIEIKTAEVSHDLSQDWYFGHKTLMQLHMTPAQFAEMITSPNMGSGVPCTISHMRDGKLQKIEPPPEKLIESEKIKENFAEKLHKLFNDLTTKQNRVKALLSGSKPIKKADREEIAKILDKVIVEIRSNMPFTIEQFNRATEKIVVTAKAEIDAFVTGMIHKTGLRELQKIQAALPDTENGIEIKDDKKERKVLR